MSHSIIFSRPDRLKYMIVELMQNKLIRAMVTSIGLWSNIEQEAEKNFSMDVQANL